MKKFAMVLLAVLLVLPLAVSCGGGEEGTKVVLNNVTLVSYANAYPAQTATGEEIPAKDESLKTEIYAGPVTAVVPEGATLCVKHIVDGYARDLDGGAVYDEASNTYVKLADLSEGNGFAWLYYVNGADAGLGTEVKEGDTVIISYERIA